MKRTFLSFNAEKMMRCALSYAVILSMMLCTVQLSSCSDDNVLDEPEIEVVDPSSPDEFLQLLRGLDGISDVRVLEDSAFEAKYECYITQYVNGVDATAGTFKQRLVIGYVGNDRPTQLSTEGYAIRDRVYKPTYRDEPSKIFDANMVYCEHRYFGKSIPDPCDYQYFNARNAAHDHHVIYTTLRKILPKKWMASNYSKGGMTAMFYRTYYPDDMAATISYSAPLCHGTADTRAIDFIANNAGTAEERERVKNIQLGFMERKDTIIKLMDERFKEKNIVLNVTTEEKFDISVLDFAFGYWSYNDKNKKYPQKTDGIDVWWQYFCDNIGLDVADHEDLLAPYYIQSYKELGNYTLDINSVPGITITDFVDANYRLTIPQEQWGDYTYDSTLHDDVINYFTTEDPHHIFIYGGRDPWYALGVKDWLDTSTKRNTMMFVYPGGNHGTTIKTFGEGTLEYTTIVSKMKEWLDID